ncbi:hypothetical protein SDC9_96779 [bioreactor metagenome]|uniref:Uncharacterized protein n=1 Tax=bioreactor metagenome TaxID=1076179 RepID=A0A645AA03_9ZZZZ
MLIDGADVVRRFGLVQQRNNFFIGKSHSNPDARQRPRFAEGLHHNKVGVVVDFTFQAVLRAEINIRFIRHYDSVKIIEQFLQILQPVSGRIVRRADKNKFYGGVGFGSLQNFFNIKLKICC